MKKATLLIAVLFCAALTTAFVMRPGPQYIHCAVCGMKPDASDAYKFRYKGTEYYFDTYNCKQTFRMNPDKFIYNRCDSVMR